jgi:hypothetical protein
LDVATPVSPSQSAGTISSVSVTRVRAFIVNDRLQAFIEGELGDGCTTLHSIAQERSGNVVTMTQTSVRQGDRCTQLLQLLNKWVPLEGVSTRRL